MVRASEGTVRTANQEDHFRQVQWFNEEGQGLALNSIPMNCSQGCPKMPRKRYQPTIVAAVAVWGVGGCTVCSYRGFRICMPRGILHLPQAKNEMV